MSRAIVLDTSVLGVASNPNASAAPCRAWIDSILQSSSHLVIPAVADYEVRRELIRQGNQTGIASLDALCAKSIYIAMDDAALKKAAWYWAQFRNTFGKQPTDPTAHRLDADVLICSQAWWYADTHGIPAVIATDNIKDFTPLLDDRFVVDANRWNAIAP